jgi:hypothetical protein
MMPENVWVSQKFEIIRGTHKLEPFTRIQKSQLIFAVVETCFVDLFIVDLLKFL